MYLPAVSDTQATLLPSQKGMCNCCSKNALPLLLFGSGGHQSPTAKPPFVYVSQPLVSASSGSHPPHDNFSIVSFVSLSIIFSKLYVPCQLLSHISGWLGEGDLQVAVRWLAFQFWSPIHLGFRALLLSAVPLLHHSESSAWYFNMHDYRSNADALLTDILLSLKWEGGCRLSIQ